jgi:hypothetical protein
MNITLGRTPEGAIKIKKDDPLGLRAVNCACCVTTGCCMYSAIGLVDELYTASDLPDTVTIGGTSYSRSGTGYGNTTNGVIFETSVWAKYTSGVRSVQPCLFQNGVIDQFLATYTLNWEGDSYAIPRIELCYWQYSICLYAPPYNNYLVALQFNEGPSGLWVAGYEPFDVFEGDICTPNGLGGFGYKIGSQNTPVGTYYAEGPDIFFTIS